MLLHLFIQNYALIEELNIDFSNGFSAITGETGAGKSIIIGALSLILGQRADNAVLLNKEKKCIIEGTFDIKKLDVEDFFKDNELDYDGQCILRREISPNGKSRAFINDTPVNLNLLKDIGDKLVDIHSQHTTLTLNNSDFQMTVLDNYAGNAEVLFSYHKDFLTYQKLKNHLKELKEKGQENTARQDYIQFLFNELDAASLKENEQDENEQELEILNNAEDIKTSLNKTIFTLSTSEFNLLSQLTDINNTLLRISSFHPQIKELHERMNFCVIELKDISNDAETIEQKILSDPSKLEEIKQRLDLIYRLEKKHNINTIEELIKVRDQISDELLHFSNLDDKIKEIEKSLAVYFDKIKVLSDTISKKRRQAIPKLEKDITDILSELAMHDARIKIDLSDNDDFNGSGRNSILFLFNANKGGEFRELAKVISGGELSRLMLAIKSVISKQNILPTVIFDEIDSGVSGDIAGKVGKIMQKMGEGMQIISITHLPQIAAKASQHYFVSKFSDGKRTQSTIKKLTNEERVEEIAKLLSNEDVSSAALATAKELMK